MNKFLRYSFMALLAMVVGNVSAQDVTFDFTLETEEGSKVSVWGFPSGSSEKIVEEKPYTYNGYTVRVAGSEGQGYYWHNKDHYLLFGKQGAYLTLPAFDFDVQRIEVVGTSGASTGVKQNIFVGDEAICTETTGAKNVTNSYDIPEGKQAAGTIYTIKVTSSHNDQISKIYIYKKGATVIDEPAFSVTGGVYLEPQTVALTCETEGAKILYTIPAGQDPVYVDDENVTGVWYDGTPLEITRTTTIKAMAVKNGQTSNIVTATYTIVNTTAKGTEADPFTVADAKLVIDALENGVTTAESYYVKGYVVGTPDIQKKADGTFYGNANFDIADTKGGSDKLTCFRLKGLNNENIESEDYIKENDQVLLFGQLQKYVKDDMVTPEIVKGYIAKIEAAGPEKNETVVGQEDNSTAWWTAFSDYYAVPASKKLHLEFVNYSSMAQNWHNWLCLAANAERGADGYYEYFALRADNWAWGDGKDTNAAGTSFWGAENYELTSNFNWDTFKADMNGAKVVMEVANDKANNQIIVEAQMTPATATEVVYTERFVKKQANFPIAVADPIQVFLTIEGGHLVIDNEATQISDYISSGISNVTTAKMVNGARYNLAGQRVNAGYKGVVIMNGQKMLVK